MARSFWQGLLFSIAGAIVGLIIVSIVVKIGWNDKEGMLIWGYGGLASVTLIVINYSNRIKKAELVDINDKLGKKADLKDIENLKCQMDLMHQSVEHSAQEQAEMHATIDNIYNLLIKKK